MAKSTRNHPVHHAARSIAATRKTTEGGSGDPSTDEMIQALRDLLGDQGEDMASFLPDEALENAEDE